MKKVDARGLSCPEPVIREELIIKIHQLALADGGGRLLARHIRRAPGQVELADAHADGAGRDRIPRLSRVLIPVARR